MIFIISEYIQKTEIKHIAKYYTLKDLKDSARKAMSSGIELSHLGYKNCKLLKVRINKEPCGRMIVYLHVQKKFVIPVVVRLKKDKVFGQNLSLSNQKAKKKIKENLDSILDDLQNGKYKKYEW